MDERELSIIQAIGEEVRDIITAMKSELAREVKSLVADAVKAAVAEIPAPVVPELPDVQQLVTSAVKAAVAEIPAPVVPELPDVPRLVADAVKAAVAEIPEPITPNDGRDALQIELEPCIDETKSYPRGTYATHKGGLWRSHQKTHGMRGWECIVDGVAGVNIHQDEERLFTISLEKASGLVEVKTFTIPVTIYRDVFKAGEEYEPGDTVTWAGSLWHCNEKTADKPGEPGTKGWTLAVKKGRDLRDKP